MRPPPLITPAELAGLLRRLPDAPLLLDVRWQLGSDDGHRQYLQAHLPGAVFVDLEEHLSGPRTRHGVGGRHPMPSVDDFEMSMAAVGVDTLRPVVVYDDCLSLAAARCWWLLRHFGKPDVRVLDGGLSAWQQAGLPVEAGEVRVDEGDFEVRRGRANTLDAAEALQYATEGVLLDGRPADRFRGENETIDPVAGHIPGAVSLPARELVEADGRLLPADELRHRLLAVGVDGCRPMAAYCGSGVQAAHLALAIAVAGLGDDVPVYVGSWSDWISDPGRPVATGD